MSSGIDETMAILPSGAMCMGIGGAGFCDRFIVAFTATLDTRLGGGGGGPGGGRMALFDCCEVVEDREVDDEL